MRSRARPPRAPRAAGGSDPATVERIWGRRIATVEGGYDDAYSAERRVDERLLARALSVHGGPGVALDVGSFYPETPKQLARLGWSVVCVDLSREVCKRIRQVGLDEGLTLRVVRCDAVRLPFRDRAFDLVTDFVTSVVTPEPATVVDEEVRVLKPGAVYVLVSNNRWTRSARRQLRRTTPGGSEHPRWGYFSPLSPLDLRSLARRYRLALLAMDSEVHTVAALGAGLALLGRLAPALRRVCGWRLGAAYRARRG